MPLPALLGILATNGLNLLAGAIQAKGKEVIEDRLGVKIPDNPDSKQLVELRALELKYETLLTEATVSMVKLEHENTASAREMQSVALQQADEFSKRFVYYLASVWSLFGIGYIIAITFATIPPENVRFADTCLGFILGTVVATILNFFFGSSQGSVKAQQFFRDVAEKLKK